MHLYKILLGKKLMTKIEKADPPPKMPSTVFSRRP